MIPVNKSCDSSAISTRSQRLLEANARLLALRERAARNKAGKKTSTSSRIDEHSRETVSAETPVLPAHLGWGSTALSGAVRRANVPEPVNPTPPPVSKPIQPPDNTHSVKSETLTVHPVSEPIQPPDNTHSVKDETVTVHPSLLAAILKQEQTAVGRVWLLTRHVDTQGRGWLPIDELRQQLTDKTSSRRICGWRRLRQILQQGDGVFWQRDDRNRLWLRGTVKVAQALDLERFAGSPIVLPLTILRSSIGDVRAAFYTAFHAGRDGQPISRQTLTEITGVSERAQRNYDTHLNVKRVKNFALLYADASAEDFYWKNRRAAFQFTDKHGKQGPPGQTYWAQRLPNSYHAPYQQLETNGTKSLNRRLKHDLAKHGTQGNGFERYPKLFYTDGKQAGRVHGSQDVFLRSDHSQSKQTFWLDWSQEFTQ